MVYPLSPLSSRCEIKVRHNNLVPMMALGVQELKKDLKSKVDYKDLDEIYQFLDHFYMSRTELCILIGQHVALHNPNPLPDCVGYIHTKMSLVVVAQSASKDARSICLSFIATSREEEKNPNPTTTKQAATAFMEFAGTGDLAVTTLLRKNVATTIEAKNHCLVASGMGKTMQQLPVWRD
ncbi:hypothetical protein ACH5RR_009186 [Cinchona calisaya]|uniref:Protein-serine/threonine kinase n=1 Tax=Cinchona calisaya TaxID=153742 RepID=A0ABD3AF88_9GENT